MTMTISNKFNLETSRFLEDTKEITAEFRYLKWKRVVKDFEGKGIDKEIKKFEVATFGASRERIESIGSCNYHTTLAEYMLGVKSPINTSKIGNKTVDLYDMAITSKGFLTVLDDAKKIEDMFIDGTLSVECLHEETEDGDIKDVTIEVTLDGKLRELKLNKSNSAVKFNSVLDSIYAGQYSPKDVTEYINRLLEDEHTIAMLRETVSTFEEM